MPNSLQKSLQLYISKLRKQTPQFKITSSTSWILSGCKHPKTPSFSNVDRNPPDTCEDDDHDAATLSDADRFRVIENFNSLYRSNDNVNVKINIKGKDHGEIINPDVFLLESPMFVEPPPPLNLHASNRFFVSPGTSSSLVEEARWSASIMSEDIASSSTTVIDESIRESSTDHQVIKGSIGLPDGSVAVLTYSPDPYNDFRRSMQEMIDARMKQDDENVDWDFIEELLFCYLNLNEKKSYKYILGAFVDLMVNLRQNSGRNPAILSLKIPRRINVDVT